MISDTDRPVLLMLFFDKYLILQYKYVLISTDDNMFLMWYMSERTSSCNTCQMSNPEKPILVKVNEEHCSKDTPALLMKH